MFNLNNAEFLTKDNALLKNVTLVYLNTVDRPDATSIANTFGMHTINGKDTCIEYLKAFHNLIVRRTRILDANCEKNVKTYNDKHKNKPLNIITCYLDDASITDNNNLIKEVVEKIKQTSIRTGMCLVIDGQKSYAVNTDDTIISDISYATPLLLDLRTGVIQ